MSDAATETKDAKTVTTKTGLKYQDHKVGTGKEAEAGKIVFVHYTGWLYNNDTKGAKFDSSVDRGKPFEFKIGVGQVIKGWDVGIVGMQVGGLRRLVIPPEMAYGSRGFGNGLIPPDSTLVFEVELLGVESASFVQGTK